jgi:hypothetical protein
MNKSKEKSKEGSKSSSKIPVARESSSKIPAARESSTKMLVAHESSTKIPAARPSTGEGRGSAGKMKAAEARESVKGRAAKAAEPAETPERIKSEDGEDGDQPKRAMGLRGAAPWAARHAAKHAAEARKRAAEPPPPGSARATIRTPTGIEAIKARIGELHNAVERVKSLRKNLNKSFFELGLVLREIQEQRMFEAKGFQNFEAFVEREIDLSKSIALRLVKLVTTFTREQALAQGYDRTLETLAQMEGAEGAQSISDSKLPIAKPVMPTSVTRGPIVGR